MKDQAEKLRQIIEGLRLEKNKGIDSESHIVKLGNNDAEPSSNTRVITITSGKGGVGKTNMTVNLGICLSNLGHRVIIIDVDFGLANIDLIFGIMTKYTLADVINGERNIEEVLTQGPGNIKFISGGSGIEELISLNKTQLDNFIKNKHYSVILNH